jgi:hypothetical protein
MKAAYKFIAGNSRITPIGIAIAAIAAAVLHQTLGLWIAPVYAAILLGTLAVSTFEPVQ